MQELLDFTAPIINFTHTTAFNLILCGGWFIYYLFVQFSTKNKLKEIEKLRKTVSDSEILTLFNGLSDDEKSAFIAELKNSGEKKNNV